MTPGGRSTILSSLAGLRGADLPPLRGGAGPSGLAPPRLFLCLEPHALQVRPVQLGRFGLVEGVETRRPAGAAGPAPQGGLEGGDGHIRRQGIDVEQHVAAAAAGGPGAQPGGSPGADGDGGAGHGDASISAGRPVQGNHEQIGIKVREKFGTFLAPPGLLGYLLTPNQGGRPS